MSLEQKLTYAETSISSPHPQCSQPADNLSNHLHGGGPPSEASTSTMTSPINKGSIGLSDPTLSETRRKKLDAINRLQNLGAQRDIDIPQIVVIGSQSAGKSSLIESISGITLPRASGTCTRCPTECRLIRSSGDSWQCTVTLRFITDEAGVPYESAQNVQFGSIIEDSKDVEKRLQQAQKAILNPSVDPKRFLDGDAIQSNDALNFSTNCVSLEIKGPGLTDLSFCDLPGLIASVSEGGRDEDVEEVKNLITSYIQKKSCIILLTVACETDFETQGAYRLAKQYDPDGVRTIGVLTKPDRIPEGEHARWLKLIRNEVSALQNGWYCVKQPSSADLSKGLTFAEARRRGEEFFRKAPWSTLDATSQKRLGTQAAILKLNEFLMAVITKRVPEIMHELRTLLQQTREQLQELPSPPSNDPVMEIMHLISDFSDALHRQAEGLSQEAPHDLPRESSDTNDRNQFEAIRSVQDIFKKAVYATEPKFLASEEGKAPHEVVEMVKKTTTRELPGFYPFHVVQHLVSVSTDKWKYPAFTLIEEIDKVIVEHQLSLIDTYFGKYAGGGLHQAVMNIMQEYRQKRRDRVEEQVRWLLKIESHAFTLNTPGFEYYKQQFLKHYQRKRDKLWDADQSAIEIMTTVWAYFQVAFRRFIDTVPLAIDYELVRVQKRTIQEELSLGLKITGPQASDSCRRLMAEPWNVSNLRDELENRRDRLLAAQKEILAI